MLEKQKAKKSKKKSKRAHHFLSKDTLEKTIQVQKARKICQKQKIGGVGASDLLEKDFR